jgi:hypothetical protein
MLMLSHQNCVIKVYENIIDCTYDLGILHYKWQIELMEDCLIYREEKKEQYFYIDEIAELQFEMAGNGNPKMAESVSASAYIIFKSDPDPKRFFSFLVVEQYTLANQSNTYYLCDYLLKMISNKYNLPYSYKLEVETKERRRILENAPVIVLGSLGLIMLMLYLRIKYGG